MTRPCRAGQKRVRRERKRSLGPLWGPCARFLLHQEAWKDSGCRANAGCVGCGCNFLNPGRSESSELCVFGICGDRFSERLLYISNVSFRPVISADINVVPTPFVRGPELFFSLIRGDGREEGKSRTELTGPGGIGKITNSSSCFVEVYRGYGFDCAY